MSSKSAAYKLVSRVVRAFVNLSGTPYPIEFVDGFAEPAVTGRSYHWTTPGGKPVYYPNAYRRAWGKPVYHCSTRAIQVGKGWLIEQGIV
jgi:hypothetical protein